MSAWASLSVQQFWQQFNWDGRPLAPQGSATVRAGLSLSLSVAQYFARIPWEGRAVVAAPVSAPVVPEEPTEELATLEDFLGDISAFF
ncbi:MAG TPA: hypothetical protein DCQ32_05730 [Cyanobacteria bacterium UBA8156]|nr:hypothetical protein [Cyanobacteria bacterium UBA8156]